MTLPKFHILRSSMFEGDAGTSKYIIVAGVPAGFKYRRKLAIQIDWKRFEKRQLQLDDRLLSLLEKSSIANKK